MTLLQVNNVYHYKPLTLLFTQYAQQPVITDITGWLRGTVVERWSSTGKLSLSCS